MSSQALHFGALKSATLIIWNKRKRFASHTILFFLRLLYNLHVGFPVEMRLEGQPSTASSPETLKRNLLFIYSCQDPEPRESAQGQMCVQNNDWVNMETNAHPSINSFGLFPVSSLTRVQNYERFHDYHDNSFQWLRKSVLSDPRANLFERSQMDWISDTLNSTLSLKISSAIQMQNIWINKCMRPFSLIRNSGTIIK